ncbi:dehydrogenase/reductase SDR family member 11-like [Eriocheir sinensis]|uniref:dehydrogenase/reductase SDR family member 11-like n=1 Tax=Eriocheir sinensis TaxID=95602 RepID=UPI0021C9F103|nr:dehydrogenase/reductase SDR family member 11-like [Eriocheir sinensis]
MERWSGRVALVTGASMGIGASVARRLVAEGMKVVGAARSIDKLLAMADELKGQRGALIPIKCDLTKDEEVLAMFAKIKKDLGGVDVCINNAGFAHNKSLLEGSPKEWREMMDLNVVALCLCTRESIASMRERGVDDGHIIHISRYAWFRLGSGLPVVVTVQISTQMYQAKKLPRISVPSSRNIVNITANFFFSMINS